MSGLNLRPERSQQKAESTQTKYPFNAGRYCGHVQASLLFFELFVEHEEATDKTGIDLACSGEIDDDVFFRRCCTCRKSRASSLIFEDGEAQRLVRWTTIKRRFGGQSPVQRLMLNETFIRGRVPARSSNKIVDNFSSSVFITDCAMRVF